MAKYRYTRVQNVGGFFSDPASSPRNGRPGLLVELGFYPESCPLYTDADKRKMLTAARRHFGSTATETEQQWISTAGRMGVVGVVVWLKVEAS